MSDIGLQVQDRAGGVRLSVRVKPRASRSRVLGVKEGQLEVAIAAPPVDGQANKELLSTLAKHLGIRRGAITLVAGETSKRKRVEVAGLDSAALLAQL